MTTGRSQLPPDVRATIVSALARSLAAAWRQQQERTHERPERLNHAAGRIVRGDGGREQHEHITVDA